MPFIERRFPEIPADAIKESFKTACEGELPAVDLFEHDHKTILEDILCILSGAAQAGNKKPYHGHIPVPQITHHVALSATKAFYDLIVGVFFHVYRHISEM